MGVTHEIPHHNLADFEPWLGYATEGQAIGDIPLQNTLEGPQYHPQPHPSHSTTIKNPHAMAELGKLDHLEERLRAIEGGEDYAFANLKELFLVPNIHTQIGGQIGQTPNITKHGQKHTNKNKGIITMGSTVVQCLKENTR